MHVRKFVAGVPLLRPLAIRLLEATAKDIQIRNPWTNDPLYLNSFRHKGYWFFRKAREKSTMLSIAKYVKQGDTIIEAGAHIGFVSQYLSKLVGPNGRVVVFEPGGNNVPYLRKNVRFLDNIILEQAAIGATNGTVRFYEDNITGQNNSLISDYSRADDVAKSHGIKLHTVVTSVRMTTLDDYITKSGLRPQFLKIDIEGAELSALRGSIETLKHVKAMMVEVTEQHSAVTDFLLENKFRIEDEEGGPLARILSDGNVFAIK